MLVDFEQIPPDGRLWIFAASRPLAADEQARLLQAVDAFLHRWKAHGAPLAAARQIRDDQFLLVAVDESSAGASGCSIDAMARVLGELERELGLELMDHAPVLFRENGEVRRVSRADFAALARAGQVTPETVVFNNTVTRIAELHDGRWETPAGRSWHARAFFPAAADR